MKSLSKSEIDFINQNLLQDVAKLALKGYDKFLLSQISARQRLKRKLPELLKNNHLIFPKKISWEQASSESTANYKSTLFKGEIGIDLTGGLGIDSIYLSRKFKKWIYLEKDYELCKIFEHNINSLNIDNIEVINSSAEDYLNTNQKYDLIYCDPSRRIESKKVFNLYDCEPNLIELFNQIKSISTNLLFKLSPLLDLKKIEKSLNKYISFYAIKSQNELKELLISNLGKKFNAIDLDEEVEISVDSNYGIINYSPPLEYLYEANPQILKLDLNDRIASENHLTKAAKNVNYYFNSELQKVPHFKCYRIIKKFNSLNEAKKEIQGCSVSIKTKNFYLNSSEIKSKYKLKESEKYALFIFNNELGKTNILLSEKCI